MDFNPVPVKAICFDLDGTLCYLDGKFDELFKNSCITILEDHPLITLEEVLNSFSRVLALEGHSTAAIVLERTFSSLGVRKPYQYGKLGQAFNALYSERVRLFDGVEDMLLELRKSYKLVLITNGPHDTQQGAINALGLGSKFDLIIISGDKEVGIRKPDPRIFQLALDTLGLSANEAVMIGDNPETDLPGARSLGMNTLLVRKGHGIGADKPVVNLVQLFLKGS